MNEHGKRKEGAMMVTAYRIYHDGEHLETVRGDLLEIALDVWHERRGDEGEWEVVQIKPPTSWGS
jgi:hypothetical protein